jgi:hypothetical protein
MYRYDIVIIFVCFMDLSHGCGIVIVPLVKFMLWNRMRFLKPLRQCLNQHVFRLRRRVCSGAGALDVAVTECGRFSRLRPREIAPGHVVEWPGPIRRAPLRHHAIRVAFQRSLEAFYAFFVIEAEAPVEAKIEPFLRFRRTG